MYGLVNRAIQQLVTERHGVETWDRIKAKAGVDEEIFIGSEGYPDELTYRLVAAASEVLGITPAQVLFAFGEHWVLRTAREEYADLLQAHGDTLKDFLLNLPNFHARVILILPKLKPPRFRVSDVSERSLVLHYMTHRPGLAPFVEGLLSGLAQMYNTPVSVTQIARVGEQGHDQFLVRW
jgi:hypothetical protein